jgi:hypothetical protein
MSYTFTAKSLAAMTYKNLQALAKVNNIRANQKAVQIRKELKKTLSAKSSSSSTRKNKLTLGSRLPSEIVEIILLEKKKAEILPQMRALLKKNEPNTTGKLWFDYDKANVFEFYSKNKPLTETIKVFKKEHIIPLAELCMDMELFNFSSVEYDKMKDMVADIRLGMNMLSQKFNIYFNIGFIREINQWIAEFNEEQEEHNKKSTTVKIREI